MQAVRLHENSEKYTVIGALLIIAIIILASGLMVSLKI